MAIRLVGEPMGCSDGLTAAVPGTQAAHHVVENILGFGEGTVVAVVGVPWPISKSSKYVDV